MVPHPENLITTSEYASKRRKAQLVHEVSKAEELRSQEYEVYSPTSVCDRIAVKDGKVYFVEFKYEGQELRPAQERIQKLVPEMYKIVYSKKIKKKRKNNSGLEQE